VGSDVTSPSSPKGILEAVLYAKDLRAIEVFYRRALGLEPYGKPDERQLFFRCGDQMLLIFNPDVTERPPVQDGKLPVPTHGARGEGHVCFRASADEITAWRAHLEKEGIEIEADFEWPGGGRSIYFRDPAGNSIEFAEPRLWGIV
jgi:catechol 2,3-dioxygenase-like lactoylglutathione lyase family enzyme